MSNIDIEIIDFFDLLNHTFSIKFVTKWKDKYGSRFVKLFQLKLLEYFKNSKRLKIVTLTNFLSKKCKYRESLIEDFYDDVEISLYSPFLY